MSGRETDDYLEVLLSRHRRRQGVKYRTENGSVNLDQIIHDKTGFKPRTVSFLPSVEIGNFFDPFSDYFTNQNLTQNLYKRQIRDRDHRENCQTIKLIATEQKSPSYKMKRIEPSFG